MEEKRTLAYVVWQWFRLTILTAAAFGAPRPGAYLRPLVIFCLLRRAFYTTGYIEADNRSLCATIARISAGCSDVVNEGTN